MIGKAHTGKGFGGLARYLQSGGKGEQAERVAWAESRNLPTDDPEAAARIMRATANDNARVQKPVYHLSLSCDPDDKPDKAELLDRANRVIDDLGLKEHQALIVAHSDTEHAHVHILVNRVHPETGKSWTNSHDYARIEKSLREIEDARGLRQVPGHHARSPGQEAPDRSQGVSTGQLRQMERDGQRPFAELAKEASGDAFKTSQSWTELHDRLGLEGLRLEKKGRGLVVTDGAEQAKASAVSRDASLKALEKRIGNYVEPERAPGQSREHGDRAPDGPGHREAGRDAGRNDGHRPGDQPGRGPDGKTAPQPGQNDDQDRAATVGQRNPDRNDRGRDRGGRNLQPGLESAPHRGAEPLALRQKLDRYHASVARQEQLKELKAEQTQAAKTINRFQQKSAWGQRQEQALDQVWQTAFRDPERAKKHFETLAGQKGGQRAALKILKVNPSEFGRMRGISVLGLKNAERKEAQAAWQQLPGEVRRVGGIRTALQSDRQGVQDAQMVKRELEPRIKALDEQRRQEPGQRAQLKEIAKEARGLSDQAWQSLSQADRQAVTSARELQKQARGRSQGSRGIDISR